MSKCKTCRFRMHINGSVGCNYMEITGKVRHLICPPGDECTVYEHGPEKRPSPMHLIGEAYYAAYHGGKKRSAAASAANTDDGNI